MDLNLKQLIMPNPNPENEYTNYEKQLLPRVDVDNSELNVLFEKHEDRIMAIVRKEIADYLADESLCNDEDGMFPRRSELTGEWYVGDIFLTEEEGRIWGSVLTRFLGFNKAPCARMPVDDYLGLEVWIKYDRERQEFVFDDSVDSSSI